MGGKPLLLNKMLKSVPTVWKSDVHANAGVPWYCEGHSKTPNILLESLKVTIGRLHTRV